MKTIKEKLPLLLATVGSLLYLTLIFNNNVWMDEAFTALLVKGSFSEMMSRSLSDTLPPLYNIWAWCFSKAFGYRTLTLKLSSVIPMIGLLYYSAFRIPSLYNKNTASCFILTLIAMPHLLSCAVEIRMYSFCLAFTTMAVISALYLLNTPEKKRLHPDSHLYAACGIFPSLRTHRPALCLGMASHSFCDKKRGY